MISKYVYTNHKQKIFVLDTKICNNTSYVI